MAMALPFLGWPLVGGYSHRDARRRRPHHTYGMNRRPAAIHPDRAMPILRGPCVMDIRERWERDHGIPGAAAQLGPPRRGLRVLRAGHGAGHGGGVAVGPEDARPGQAG